MAGKKSPREQEEEILRKAANDLEEINEMMEKWKSLDKLKEPYPIKKKRGGTVSRKRGGGYIKPKENIIDDNASIRSRLRSEKRRKKAIKKAASKKRGGRIMYVYKAGGKV